MGLVREAANTHTEDAAAREGTLQAKVKAIQEVKRVKKALACQAEQEVASLMKKLEVAEQRAKDVVDDLRAMVESMFALSLSVDFMGLLGLCLIFELG
jgi:hypothetical protein